MTPTLLYLISLTMLLVCCMASDCNRSCPDLENCKPPSVDFDFFNKNLLDQFCNDLDVYAACAKEKTQRCWNETQQEIYMDKLSLGRIVCEVAGQQGADLLSYNTQLHK
ncbi:uncharacterized protein LOC131935506 [Physella acuta]|uniref:uncharacterized protein LOC131935506 n=1 Tax=Physella acuta TaxID=109671 RepID=UPI0027DE4BC6|nr:uncharacterized protein LOC131935506 [Physella acuta]